VPLSRWSGPDLASELAVRCGIAASASTIRRRLARDALRPWQHRSRSPSATRSSRPGPPGCWICTPGSGTAGRWARMTT
jgi:hypothetical protein